MTWFIHTVILQGHPPPNSVVCDSIQTRVTPRARLQKADQQESALLAFPPSRHPGGCRTQSPSWPSSPSKGTQCGGRAAATGGCYKSRRRLRSRNTLPSTLLVGGFCRQRGVQQGEGKEETRFNDTSLRRTRQADNECILKETIESTSPGRSSR